MSGKKAREERREERLQKETEAEAKDRRQLLVRAGSAAVFLAIAVVAVLIVISQSENDGGDTNVEGVEVVQDELAGVPQNGMAIGEPQARVRLIEFGDLQCPVCKSYAEEVLPEVIASKVQTGEAKVEFRNFIVIGEESETAGAAALAAGQQDRGWSFVELFYRNQGEEASGYVTDDFLTSIAEAAGVPDIAKWNADRKSRSTLKEVSRTASEAQELGFTGTPSFAVGGPRAGALTPIGTPGSAEALEEAIEEAR
jgi:protein-disulfide isomerase